MPQICKVCVHPARHAIDGELSRDWERSLRAIGAEYRLSKDTLYRHCQRHLPETAEDSPSATDLAEQEKVYKTILSEPQLPDDARQQKVPKTIDLAEQEKKPTLTPRERVAELMASLQMQKGAK